MRLQHLAFFVILIFRFKKQTGNIQSAVDKKLHLKTEANVVGLLLITGEVLLLSAAGM